MPIKGLYFIVNRRAQSADFLIHLCEQALLGGADTIQFRDKNPISQEMISIAQELSALCSSFSVPFILNDHIHLYETVPFDGVHIGQQDISIPEARRLLGNQLIIGKTCATVAQAQQAEREGADYIGCGHIYPTTTKIKTTPPLGPEGLREIVQAVSIPVTAIGGITVERIPAVLASHPASIAVISAIEKHPNPQEVCRKMKEVIQLCTEKSTSAIAAN